MIDKFQKLHNCKIDYFTAKKDLFINEYPNIKFYNYGDVNSVNYCAQYTLGCFAEEKTDLFRKDWRLQSLQEIAFSILGLDYVESKTKITIKNKFKLNFNKYVCIATQSTSQAKYWNYENGWEKIIEYLKKNGYDVICVDKHEFYGNLVYMNSIPINAINKTGLPLNKVANIINKCDFFIGLDSGLSWLAWALNKKVIQILGITGKSIAFENKYGIINKNVCNTCFSDKNLNIFSSDVPFNDFLMCPKHKNTPRIFECTKSITPEMVIEKIDQILNEKTR